MDLLESESSDDDEKEKKANLSINRRYASKFEAEGRFKDLQRAKELALNSDLDESSIDEADESSESEDEDGNILDSQLELKIVDTINCLRRKDPKIYDTNTKFFYPDDGEDRDKDTGDGGINGNIHDDQKEKSKRKTYKTVLREQLLRDGAGSDDVYDDNEMNVLRRGKSLRKSNIAYDEEQRGLRDRIINDLHGDGVHGEFDDDGDGDDILVLKEKNPEEKEEEERQIKEALKEMNDLGDASTSEGDKFLTDYLANKRWKDKTGYTNMFADDRNDDNDAEDEKHLEEMDRFESKYNFRFEEAGGEINPLNTQIVGHSRNIDNSFRKTDDRRKIERENRKERKDKERRQKEAELRRLKNVKRIEIQERLKKINAIGDAEFASEEFLDEEWDPNKYEAQMAAQFNDDYYDAAHGDDDMPLEHPGELEAWNEEDYEYERDENGDEESLPVKKSKSKADKKKKIDDKNVEEELYKLDYEDIVAGIPTRFKYRQVEPESYGLTAEDILLADDDDLNQYISLKKLATYRTDGDKHARNLDKKRKRLRSKLKEKREELTNQEAELEMRSSKDNLLRGDKNAVEDEFDASQGSGKKKRNRKRNDKSKSKHRNNDGLSKKRESTEKDSKASKKRREKLYDI